MISCFGIVSPCRYSDCRLLSEKYKVSSRRNKLGGLENRGSIKKL